MANHKVYSAIVHAVEAVNSANRSGKMSFGGPVPD